MAYVIENILKKEIVYIITLNFIQIEIENCYTNEINEIFV